MEDSRFGRKQMDSRQIIWENSEVVVNEIIIDSGNILSVSK